MSPTRRALLNRTALTISGATLASLAGCLGRSVPAGTDNPDETSSATPTSRPDDRTDSASETDFERWLPDPTTTTPLRDGYGVRYFDAATIRERQDSLHENAYERLGNELSNAGPSTGYVDEDDVDTTLGFGFDTSVALGSFDPGEFEARYADEQRSHGTVTTTSAATATPVPEPERYAGFDIYGTDHVFAVSEDAIVEVGHVHEASALEYAKAVIDAPGTESTYSDGNEYVNAMLGLVDEPHALKCYPEAMDGSTARGFREDVITGGLKSWRFGSETTRLTFAYTYPDAEAAKSADLEAYIESESARFGAYEGLGVRTEGRLVWTEGTVPTAEFDYLSPGGPGDGVHTPNG